MKNERLCPSQSLAPTVKPFISLLTTLQTHSIPCIRACYRRYTLLCCDLSINQLYNLKYASIIDPLEHFSVYAALHILCVCLQHYPSSPCVAMVIMSHSCLVTFPPLPCCLPSVVSCLHKSTPVATVILLLSPCCLPLMVNVDSLCSTSLLSVTTYYSTYLSLLITVL